MKVYVGNLASEINDTQFKDLVTPFGQGAAHGNFLAFRTPDAVLARVGEHLAPLGVSGPTELVCPRACSGAM